MPSPKDIRVHEFLQISVAQLRRHLDQVQRVVDLCSDEENGHSRHVSKMNYCALVDCPQRRRLREEAERTIEVLDKTRTAFRSKELAELRKRWTRLLKEI